MQLVGIRDLKNKLTHYLESAKKGDAIIITDRGVPVTILHNLDQIEEKAGPEERLAHLPNTAFSACQEAKAAAFPPVERARVKGEPVSETIAGERR